MKKYLALLPFILLCGCKEAAISGRWQGDVEEWSQEWVKERFLEANPDIAAQDVNVSKLDEQKFTIAINQKNLTYGAIKGMVQNVEHHRDALTLSDMTVEWSVAENESEQKEVAKWIEELTFVQSMPSAPSQTQLDWSRARVIVYQLQSKATGIYAAFDTGEQPVYCGIDVPLKTPLPPILDLDISKPLTRQDVPADIQARYTPQELEKELQIKNARRERMSFLGNFFAISYPHKTLFKDSFLKDLKERERPERDYFVLKDSKLTISAGALENTTRKNPSSGATALKNYDFGGLLHDKCESMIAKNSPEMMNKINQAWRYRAIKLGLNPQWRPDND